MPAKKFIALLCITATLLISGCAEIPANDYYDAYDEPLATVEMRVKEGTLTPTGLTLILTNNTNREYMSGVGFHIERRVDGEWAELEPLNNLVFVSLGVPFPPNTSIELERIWDWYYGELEPGEYRIIKGYHFSREPGNLDEYEVYAEFVIE